MMGDLMRAKGEATTWLNMTVNIWMNDEQWMDGSGRGGQCKRKKELWRSKEIWQGRREWGMVGPERQVTSIRPVQKPTTARWTWSMKDKEGVLKAASRQCLCIVVNSIQKILLRAQFYAVGSSKSGRKESDMKNGEWSTCLSFRSVTLVLQFLIAAFR